MNQGNATPQPSGLIAEYLYSICTPHGVRVADCTTCRPTTTTGGAR